MRGQRGDGRGIEIQRLIGRALRATVNMDAFGSRTFYLDCDVLQADGGTRAVAITGGWIAIYLAAQRLLRDGEITTFPLSKKVAAVSLGIVDGQALLDLDYEEDKRASIDVNLVMTDTCEIVELQVSGEKSALSRPQLNFLLAMGIDGIQKILEFQKEILFRMGYV